MAISGTTIPNNLRFAKTGIAIFNKHHCERGGGEVRCGGAVVRWCGGGALSVDVDDARVEGVLARSIYIRLF